MYEQGAISLSCVFLGPQSDELFAILHKDTIILIITGSNI